MEKSLQSQQKISDELTKTKNFSSHLQEDNSLLEEKMIEFSIKLQQKQREIDLSKEEI